MLVIHDIHLKDSSTPERTAVLRVLDPLTVCYAIESALTTEDNPWLEVMIYVSGQHIGTKSYNPQNWKEHNNIKTKLEAFGQQAQKWTAGSGNLVFP